MHVFDRYAAEIDAALDRLTAAGALPSDCDRAGVSVEPPRDPAHGDIATNAALALAKRARANPRALGTALAEALRGADGVAEATVAGPGFVNIRLSDDVWRAELARALSAGGDYGRSGVGGGRKVSVEYVSANPTGPLHVGHVRGAVFGDALADLLAYAGFDVTREYYVNDAGAQVDKLARSAHHRYLEALGRDVGPVGEGLYPGDYLIPVGAALVSEFGARFADAPESEWLAPVRDVVVAAMLARIREDLAALGVNGQRFASERAIAEDGRLDAALAALTEKGLVYVGELPPPKGKPAEDWEPRPQTLFRATAWGDDVDRPLKKSDGSWTYFAPDIAYHRDKAARGAEVVIDVLGADHGGYVKRIKAVVAALTDGAVECDVKLCQLVRLTRGGVPVKMSKRAGDFITAREVVDEVGKDVLRFIMLTRTNDAPLDFDFDKVMEQSRDNPVFYVQYAHARAHSALRKAAEAFPDFDPDDLSALARADLAPLAAPEEIALMRRIAGFPRAVEQAALAHEPHRIAFWLGEMAAAFHGLWNLGKEREELRIVAPDDRRGTIARAALIRGAAEVIAAGLRMLGVTPVKSM